MLAGTCVGNLGILNIETRAYTTVMRSHINRILSLSLDPSRRQMATVSEDHTIRVWDLDTMQQACYPSPWGQNTPLYILLFLDRMLIIIIFLTDFSCTTSVRRKSVRTTSVFIRSIKCSHVASRQDTFASSTSPTQVSSLSTSHYSYSSLLSPSLPMKHSCC